MIKKRAEVDKKYIWKIEDIYNSELELEKDFLFIKENLEFSSYQGNLEKEDVLYECLIKLDNLSLKMGFLEVYAMMKKDEDSSVSKSVELKGKIDSLYSDFASAVSFITPEITAFSNEKLQNLINNEKFKDYNRYFENILKDKSHILGAEAEQVLSMGGQVFRSFRGIFDMIDNVDFAFPTITHNGEKIVLTHGAYSVCLHSEDRELRKKAYKAYYKAYKKCLNIITVNYTASVNKDVFLSKVRKYDSALNRALNNEEVSVKVYENLLKSVKKALPTVHNYVAERKKILGLDKMNMYDLYVSLVDDYKLEKTYEDAYALVEEGLSVLGEEYSKILHSAFLDGWIDVEETYGKRSGAYSVGVYGLKHPYVLLNYQKTAHNVFTIAHEMGHAIHTYYSNKNQPQVKADYTIFVAEVASTVNEVLLLNYLLGKEKDNKAKRYYLNYFLDMFRTTLFRQTMFAEFEYKVHSLVEQGQALSRDVLNDIYLKLNKKYYGKSVISDKEISYEWARIPHFYSAFYVYKYATGIISAVSIADKILSKEKGAVENYIKFLSSGCSDTPVNLLKIAGVDLEMEEPFDRAMKVFENTLNQFIQLNDKE